MPLRTEPGPSSISSAPSTVTEWRTVRCENEECRHIVFKFRRDALVSGSVIVQVKCRCKTMNTVRIGATVK